MNTFLLHQGSEGSELFKNIETPFKQNQNEENIEFEMRLGKINTGSFDTNVGESNFNKILIGLKKYKGWEDVVETTTSVYYKDNVRTSVDEESEESISIFKKNILKKNFNIENKPYDVRFSISKEIPTEIEEDDTCDSVRLKKRISFIRKNLSIDMTIVTGDPTDLDCEDEAQYQIELEIVDPTKVKDTVELYNIIYKIFDVLKIIST
jgi:hypothetical protein